MEDVCGAGKFLMDTRVRFAELAPVDDHRDETDRENDQRSQTQFPLQDEHANHQADDGNRVANDRCERAVNGVDHPQSAINPRR